MPSIDPASDPPAAERGGNASRRDTARQDRSSSAAAASLRPAADALAAAADALEADEPVDLPSLGRLAAYEKRPPETAPALEPAGARPPATPPAAGPSVDVLARAGTGEAERTGGNRRRRPETAPPAPAPAGSGPGGPRSRKPHRKLIAGLLIGLSVLLILAAVGVGGYPFYTDIQAARHQKVLAADLARAAKATGDARLKLIQEYADRNFATGSAITTIIIPAINVNSVVVQGTTDAALNVGAGHYPQTPLPGQVGNVAIAGHRTMNGHPFGDLNKLAPGDKVILKTPFATYTYQLVAAFDGHANPWVVQPTDWSIIAVPTQDHLLTLTTCNPPGQQTTRLVARATLVSTQPA